MFSGSWADKHGRKVPCMIGMLSVSVSTFGILLFVTIDSIPMWFPIVTNGLGGFLGYIAILPITCFAFIADITATPESMTIRMVVINVCVQLSLLVGNLLTGVASETVIKLAKLFTRFPKKNPHVDPR